MSLPLGDGDLGIHLVALKIDFVVFSSGMQKLKIGRYADFLLVNQILPYPPYPTPTPHLLTKKRV